MCAAFKKIELPAYEMLLKVVHGLYMGIKLELEKTVVAIISIVKVEKIHCPCIGFDSLFGLLG